MIWCKAEDELNWKRGVNFLNPCIVQGLIFDIVRVLVRACVCVYVHARVRVCVCVKTWWKLEKYTYYKTKTYLTYLKLFKKIFGLSVSTDWRKVFWSKLSTQVHIKFSNFGLRNLKRNFYLYIKTLVLRYFIRWSNRSLIVLV